MQGMPNPSFDPNQMQGQAESARANMGDTRHQEQVREADRANGEGTDSASVWGRFLRWLLRR
jgi:hypothetical protein